MATASPKNIMITSPLYWNLFLTGKQKFYLSIAMLFYYGKWLTKYKITAWFLSIMFNNNLEEVRHMWTSSCVELHISTSHITVMVSVFKLLYFTVLVSILKIKWHISTVGILENNGDLHNWWSSCTIWW